MMIKVVNSVENTEQIIDSNDLYDVIEAAIDDEYVENWLNEVYEPIDIPIVGLSDMGYVARQLLGDLDWSFLRDDIIDTYIEDINYELCHYDESSLDDFKFYVIDDEEEGAME